MDQRIVADYTSTKGLKICEKYMKFVNYVYPMTVNWSGKHRVFRDTFLSTALNQVQLFYDAAKSSQISRLYIADSGLATIREYLKFAADKRRHLMSEDQLGVAETLISESGGMLNSWIERKKEGKGRSR